MINLAARPYLGVADPDSVKRLRRMIRACLAGRRASVRALRP